jgi:hypothetical protein
MRAKVKVMMRSLWVAALLATSVFATRVHAQEAGNKAAAEALFDEARRLMADGHYAQACSKFEASQALDAGVGTLLNLADCYEKSGKTASAWAQFRETISAARRSGSLERERIARQHVDALEPKLSYLTIVTWKGQEVNVTRDGVAVDSAVLGTAIPVDPGTHVISAAAPGKRSWSTTIKIGEQADRVSVSVPILPDEPNLASTAPLANELQPPPSAAAPANPSNPGSAQRWLAIIAAGVGVAGIATGTVFGIQAASSWSDAKSNCNPYPYCGGAGQRLAKDAKNSGTISTIGFVAGGVGLAAGVLLWFTAPPRATETRPIARDASEPLAFDLGPGAVQMRGRF